MKDSDWADAEFTRRRAEERATAQQDSDIDREPVTRATPAAQTLLDIIEALDHLQKEVSALNEQCAPALAPATTVNDPDLTVQVNAAPPEHSDLVLQLTRIRESIGTVTDHLISIRTRLEI